MKIPIIGVNIDERFLEHRKRSTSQAGIVGGFVAVGLFVYRLWFNHIWNWDLFAVGATIGAVKLALMAWYSFKD